MTTAQITTKVQANGLTVAADPAQFDSLVNGTATYAVRYADRWVVHYTSPKGRKLRKSLPIREA